MENLQPPDSESSDPGDLSRVEPVGVLPYASPRAYDGAGVWRERNVLVLLKGSPLPPTCVKCTAPAVVAPWSKTVYWHHPALYLMILFPGVLTYAIVALCVRHKAEIEAGLCPVHRAKRRNRLAITWLLGLASIGSFFAAMVNAANQPSGRPDPTMARLLLLGIVLLVAACICGFVGSRVLWPTKINANYVWLKGCGPEFLDNFSATGS